MIKNATVNGKSLSVWGAALLSDAINTLLTPSPMKDYITNESRLEHGSRYIPANAKVASREISLPFLIEGSSRADFLSKYMSFVDELYRGTIALHITELNKTFTLLYLSCGKYGSYGDCKAKLIVKFIEPIPVQNRV